jgi:hypothetical protein
VEFCGAFIGFLFRHDAGTGRGRMLLAVLRGVTVEIECGEVWKAGSPKGNGGRSGVVGGGVAEGRWAEAAFGGHG